MSVLRHLALVALLVSPAAPADESECSGEYCRSPDPWGGHDCWAGSDVERCTCSRGSARMTGGTTYYEGKTYYEYTCCPDDGYNQGEECGDYNPDADTVAGIIGGVFILFLFLAIIC